MDNHPIPQEVTNFQFRLIGDMTLKQFAYIAVGVVVGWLVFSLPLFFIIKAPLALVSVGMGPFLAFVPLEGRPSDMMLLYFIRALFAPNQYIFAQQKPTAQTSLGDIQQTTYIDTKQQEVKKEEGGENKKVFFQSLPSITQTVTTQIQQKQQEEKQNQKPVVAQSSPQVLPIQKENLQEAQMAQKAQVLAVELEEAKKQEAEKTNQVTSQEAHAKVLELQSQMLDLQKQKEDLEKRLLAMQQAKPSGPVFTPTTAPIEKKETSHVRKIPTQMAQSLGAPFFSDSPNLVTGIARDSRGNILPNILIEVQDKDNNPVRAFKTNNLGQFASATPLLNGTYTLTFEDPQGAHTFDSVEITATGENMLPIEVISVDQREKLRQELFGQLPIAQGV